VSSFLQKREQPYKGWIKFANEANQIHLHVPVMIDINVDEKFPGRMITQIVTTQGW
jgi:hypothetical protein